MKHTYEDVDAPSYIPRVCEVCKTAGQLQDCPGRELDSLEQLQTTHGHLDFIQDSWVILNLSSYKETIQWRPLE